MANIFESAFMTLKNGMTMYFADQKARANLKEKYGTDNPPPYENSVWYAVCGTAAGTATKEVTVSGITALTAGLSINVKFINANSASNPKLKINDLGAVPIYQYGTTAASTSAATTGWQAGAVVQLTYDGVGFVRDQGYNTNSTYSVSSVLCTTSAGTAAKASSNAAYYVLRAGNIFEITFRYSNTKASALTLNVNSTGAKPIYINGEASSATNYTLPAGKYICYYDGTNYYIDTTGKAPISVTGSSGSGGSQNTWYATCSTASGTTDKVAISSSGDFVLATGNMVRILFSDTNIQPQPTLSVDGCTAKRIKNITSDNDITTKLWRAGEVVDVVYDGTDFIVVDGGLANGTYYGRTILSNSTSSASQTTAATSKAVKDTYDAIPDPSDATPQDLGTADPGTSGDYSRADHVHKMPTASDLVDLIYPIGSIYMSVNSTNPGTLFGGTWQQIEDTFLLSAGQTYTAGDTGGSATMDHTHTMAHTHNLSANGFAKMTIYTEGSRIAYREKSNCPAWTTTFRTASVGSAAASYSSGSTWGAELGGSTDGSSAANTGAASNTNNMPPYLVVYVWKRTA